MESHVAKVKGFCGIKIMLLPLGMNALQALEPSRGGFKLKVYRGNLTNMQTVLPRDEFYQYSKEHTQPHWETKQYQQPTPVQHRTLTYNKERELEILN